MVRIGLRGAVIGTIVLAAGCTTGGAPSPGEQRSDLARAPVPDVSSIDRDHDRIDDALQLPVPSTGEELVEVEAIFAHRMPVGATAELERVGGKVRHVFQRVSNGFSGKVPRSQIPALAAALGPDLLVLKGEQPLELHLDRATKAARVRSVWAPGFAGAPAGIEGSSKVNIAIVDGGVDPTHPDLAGRMIGWKDYTADAKPTASDSLGHGTHVAGVALGSGAAFGVGPGPLAWTDSGSVEGMSPNEWNGNAITFPPAFSLTSTATFLGGPTTVSVLRGDEGKTSYSSQKTSAVGASPLTLTFDGNAPDGTHYTLGLRQNAAQDVTRYAIANRLAAYPAVGDGYPALRGVAPGSGWYGAKIFPSDTTAVATSADINAALDDIALIAESLDIKVVNCSFGLRGGATDPTQRAKVNALVDLGILVVSSAGNNGATGATGDPGRASKTLTVGAVNDVNALASYSSGAAMTAADTDDKPDVVAPGGSSYRTKILAPDSNTGDAQGSDFADVQPNDYTSNLGTSMAAPLVSGSAALLIQALEAKGHVWSWGSSDSPRLVKMLLGASATETNALRESGANNPLLGRGASPKDRMEGYGLINPDAAIEAATTTWDLAAPLTGTSDGSVGAKRAWGRKIKVPAGRTLKLTMTQSSTADYDVYAYLAEPSAKGTPQLVQWSDRTGLGETEVTTWTYEPETELYLFVKRIAGSGSFSLDGATFECGNGTIEPGEECDDGNVESGDCCSVACQLESPACGGDGGTIPQGNVPDGGDDAGPDPSDAGADADADAEGPPPEGGAPFEDPNTQPTAPPSSPPPVTTSTTPPQPVEQLDAGGGGCATTPAGSSSAGAALALALASLAAVRRRRRA
ncbi:MAG: S8 family serine peptidase [Labilithrix sp.]|nr:S8 family serine peptidase [Labilithrix sp.]MCW5811998.1 S8 family serine peptidase [Labilithrix sp.]